MNCERCGAEEFLPFTCSYCKNTYCVEHHLPENHECQNIEIMKNFNKQNNNWFSSKYSNHSEDGYSTIEKFYFSRDEIKDPQNLKMWLDINGKRMQEGSTKTMVYGVNFLVSYVSNFMSLQPGDIISTGTPPGVGMGLNPQVWLKPGDEMHLGIEGLGEQKQKTISA